MTRISRYSARSRNADQPRRVGDDRKEEFISSTPVTGRRIPGIASPTAIASTESEKIRLW